MAYFPLLSFLLLLLLHPLFSTANLDRTSPLRQELLTRSSTVNDAQPTNIFEVTKPIEVPRTKPCSYLILQHDFGFTFTKPPVFANYTPPTNCPSQTFSKVVFEWKASCKGTQFDRIFGVWLGGVELFRSSTAEPTATGIVWSVEKDITRYYSLLMTNQTLAVYLGNLVNSIYTGVYHVNITIHFYPAPAYEKSKLPWADLILPFSRNLPINDALWFEIQNSADVQSKEFQIPQNAYRAVLEVYVSFHGNDEFWYSNDRSQNGPFREVVVSLDGEIVGAIWPFTVIYTGGINPLFWRPITGIGSFNLPSYNIEITPFLGKILDGKTHKIGFGVTNALNMWYIDANLYLWLDSSSKKIEGKLLEHITTPLNVSVASNGTFLTSARRSISSIGWVKSSHGTITTHWNQDFSYSNSMVTTSDLQIVNQTIHFNDTVRAETTPSTVHSISSSRKKFTLYEYSKYSDQGNGASLNVDNVTLGFNENKFEDGSFGLSKSSLENVQSGQVNVAAKNNRATSVLARTQQVYKYDESNFCYFRNISSSNFAILFDEVGNTCH